jgi:putative endonuclease
MAMQFVYLIRCIDGCYYTGCTNNLDERLSRHNKGQIHFTKTRLPVELVCYIAFTNKFKAFEFEKYLKSGSGIGFRNNHFL